MTLSRKGTDALAGRLYQQVIRQILKHLSLWIMAPSRDPPNTNSSPKNHEPVYEMFDDLYAFNEHADGCPGYDESCIAQN